VAKIDAVEDGGKSFAVTYTEYGNSESIPVSRTRPLVKVGDTVEGQFTEDDVWYVATIDSVTDGKYAVTYTEYGNKETIPRERIRVAAAAASGLKWKVGDVIEGQFTEDDVWYVAKIDSITDGKYAVTYTEYGNNEVIPEERTRPASGTGKISFFFFHVQISQISQFFLGFLFYSPFSTYANRCCCPNPCSRRRRRTRGCRCCF